MMKTELNFHEASLALEALDTQLRKEQSKISELRNETGIGGRYPPAVAEGEKKVTEIRDLINKLSHLPYVWTR